jgi:hypothetical protein
MYKQPYEKTPLEFKGGKRKVRVAEIADTVTEKAKSDPSYVKSKPYPYVENGQKKIGVKNIYKIPKSELETTTLPGGMPAKKARKQTVVKNIFDTAMYTTMGVLSGAYANLMRKK